ncbi:MAG: DUF3418 domain-containing protein [Chitinispirillaceae bacterium]|nr:DUF3418 domain-containing protein [Chitinispirillaceae bacterium]
MIALWKGSSIDSFIEGALRATEEIIASGNEGDILLFMPTVDDVMEAVSRLRHRLPPSGTAVFPLHGRLVLEQQKRVFARFDGRKIVVATNIAETSLTVPGIRFVIDTGLARVLRYEPGAAITRMPVERVSKASADQRCGRCGRERDGVCIRLYSEQDYLSRSRFTLPEIKRAGLAGLLLRMAALRLGNPWRFPFPQRPASVAIKEGYRKLQDIGAIDRKKNLTGAGRTMARFPLDPPVARMLLKAKQAGVVPEVMVIAAALSAQEPLCGIDGETRNIPRELMYQGSDFCTYLKVWNRLRAVSRGKGYLPWGRLKTFCEKYGFQPLRIREWTDAYGHIRRICNDLPDFPDADEPLPPVRTDRADAVHRCLLAGLVHGVAVRTGSGVYEGIGTGEIRIASSSVTARKQFPWLLFHEIVDTGRIYGTRAAAIDPKWIEELFAQQCTYRHEDPLYDPVSGNVSIREEVYFRSLPLIRNRMVDCVTVDRECAREVFIREALTGEELSDRYRFITVNREVRQSVRDAERKLRRSFYAGDEAVSAFYEERVPAASRKEFDTLLRARGGDAFLILPRELLLTEPLPDNMDEYADMIAVASYRLPVGWVHAEGDSTDGATVRVPERLASTLPLHYWEWQLPVLVRQRTEMLVARLTGLLLARSFDPADVVDALNGLTVLPDRPYGTAVAGVLEEQFGIPAATTRSTLAELPAYVWIRLVVTDVGNVGIHDFRPPFATGHAVGSTQETVVSVLSPITDGLHRQIQDRWESIRFLEPLPCTSPAQQVPCIVYVALRYGEGGAGTAVYTSRHGAVTAHAEVLRRLCEERCAEEIAWAIETLLLPESLVRNAAVPRERLHESAVRLFERYVCQLPRELPCSDEAFETMAGAALERCKEGAGVVACLLERTFAAIDRCKIVLVRQRTRYSAYRYEPLHHELEQALDRYRETLFSTTAGSSYIMHLPEYLEAFSHRSTAAFLDTALYRSVMREVHAAETAIDQCEEQDDYVTVIAREELREMVEQYIIGQFTGGVGGRGVPVTAEDLSRCRLRLEEVSSEEMW